MTSSPLVKFAHIRSSLTGHFASLHVHGMKRARLAALLALTLGLASSMGCSEGQTIEENNLADGSTPDSALPGQPNDMGTSDMSEPADTTSPPPDLSTPEDLGTDSGMTVTPDAASADMSSPDDMADMPEEMTPEGTPIIVGVGYGGLIIRSEDRGMTWNEVRVDPWLDEKEDPMCTDEPDMPCERKCRGGDDKCLLRAVTYNEGLFVAVGWKIFTSPDGLTWTERTVERQNWCGGVDYGHGKFICAGGCGNHYTSMDGLSWMSAGKAATGGCAHIRSLAFGNGRFVGQGNNNLLLWSSDGEEWTQTTYSYMEDGEEKGLGTIIFRDGEFLASGGRRTDYHLTSPNGEMWTRQEGRMLEFFGHGAYFTGGKTIERSEDGETWQTVQEDLEHSIQSYAFGYVP